MKNTEKLSKSDNITLSKKDLEKVKSNMFEAGYLAGAQKLDITEKDLVEISLNLTQAAKIVEKTNPKLADWLKFVNRKAIALVNKEKEK
ncbi:MAG: hypothetical protein ACOYCB_14475 [Fastidiosipilaceae bacterium]|jgi:hypothetical protein